MIHSLKTATRDGRPTMERTAAISDCGAYRYELARRWGPGSSACFVMLNPSTADGLRDDPTIRKCVGFARMWECDAIRVVNLFAFRATDPGALRAAGYPVGPENDGAIGRALSATTVVVAAWGAHAPADRAALVLARLTKHWTVWCLGRTAGGQPRHPLMVPYSRPLEIL